MPNPIAIPKRGPGRPTKLTEEAQRRLTEALLAGNYRHVACTYAGISNDAFLDWLNKGEAGDPRYHQFYEAVKKAEADAVVRIVALWQRQIPDNWQAGATFLERRYPQEWGKRVLEMGGPGGGPIIVKVIVEYAPEERNPQQPTEPRHALSSGNGVKP